MAITWTQMPRAEMAVRPFDGGLVLLAVPTVLGPQFGGGLDPSAPHCFYLAGRDAQSEHWGTTETDEETEGAFLIGFQTAHLRAEVD